MIYYETKHGQLHQGHVLTVLQSLSDESVDCCVTSPPYWGLRDYGTPPQIWGGTNNCDHKWNREKWLERNKSGRKIDQYHCIKCNAWKGSLGLEPTMDLFLDHLSQVFSEIKRVLKPTGTLWLNINDSYSGSQTCGGAFDEELGVATFVSYRRETPGLRAKNMTGIPWRLASMLQEDGWYWRQCVIWAKGVSYCSTYSGSVMTESVEDRFTKSHEYILLFSKKSRYYFDREAILEYPNTKNERIPRSVWIIPPNSIEEDHYATFPTKIAEIAIKAGSSAYGCCVRCGAPYKEYVFKEKAVGVRLQYWDVASEEEKAQCGINTNPKMNYGWWPTCRCYANEIAPSVIIDPFSGTGTSLLVAEQLKRDWIGIELSPKYCEVTKQQFMKKKYGLKVYKDRITRKGLIPMDKLDISLK